MRGIIVGVIIFGDGRVVILWSPSFHVLFFFGGSKTTAKVGQIIAQIFKFVKEGKVGSSTGLQASTHIFMSQKRILAHNTHTIHTKLTTLRPDRVPKQRDATPEGLGLGSRTSLLKLTVLRVGMTNDPSSSDVG